MSQIKVETLTDEQKAKFPEYIKIWTDIGLSTEPANREEAEKAINESYRLAGKEPPNKIVWCGSPLSQGLVRAIILDKKLMENMGENVERFVWDSIWASVWASVRDSVRASVGDSVRASVGDSVWDSIWDSVRDSVGDSVWDSVRDSIWASVRDSVGASVGDSVRASVWASVGDSVWASVWASVRDSVGDSVWDSVRDSVGASVRDSVRASVGDSVRDSVRASVGDSVWDSGYGSHDANWLAFCNYFRNETGLLDETEKLNGLTELCKHAGWWLPHENICWVSERHCVLNRDDKGRIHSLTAPAIAYPDGWAIYAVHGVRVPEYIILRPEEITVEKIEQETNAEIRRVMIDKFGQQNYIEQCGAVLVHEDETGQLYRKELPNDEDIVMVKVINSTAEPDGEFKNYFLRVPPTIQRAKEGVAWTFGLEEHEYQPKTQT